MSSSISEPQRHFDWVAEHGMRARAVQRDFHQQLLRHFRHHIPEDSSVLECGCGTGELIAGLRPRRGLGIDISPVMLAMAKARYGSEANLQFIETDVHVYCF